MKRKKFIKHLNISGCDLLRHGSNHDIYINLKNGKKQPLPRHTEIEHDLIKHICKNLNIKSPF